MPTIIHADKSKSDINIPNKQLSREEVRKLVKGVHTQTRIAVGQGNKWLLFCLNGNDYGFPLNDRATAMIGQGKYVYGDAIVIDKDNGERWA